MAHYLIRRSLWGLLTLLLITFFVYGLIRMMPGDPILARMAEANPDKKVNLEALQREREKFYLNDPVPFGYVLWLGDVARGDLQTSISRLGVRVSSLIRERIGATLLLTCTSLILTYLLCIPIGLFSTMRSGRPVERGLSTLLYMLYSLPSFVGALFLQILFVLELQDTPFALPLRGIHSAGFNQMSLLGQAADVFRHAVLPVTCFTYTGLAYYSRFIKANMNEVIRQDYIRTARAKGVGRLRVVLRHAFRNTLVPLVTQIGLTLPALLSGAVILEQIFTWPGMGSLFFESIRERDYPTIMGLVLMFSILTLVGQLLADFLYSVVDPRVSYS